MTAQHAAQRSAGYGDVLMIIESLGDGRRLIHVPSAEADSIQIVNATQRSGAWATFPLGCHDTPSGLWFFAFRTRLSPPLPLAKGGFPSLVRKAQSIANSVSYGPPHGAQNTQSSEVSNFRICPPA